MAVINYTPDNTKIIHNTRVDFSLRKAIPSIHIVQYDTSLPIVKVDLYLGGQPYVIPANADLRVRVGKKDKTYVYKDVLGCTPDRKSVYFEIDDQMTIFFGDINPILDLVIKEGEVVRKAGSSPIYVTIDRNPVQNDYKQSTTSNHPVDNAVEIAEKARDEAITAKDAAVVAKTGSENARNDSMAAKVAAEAARDISVTAKNESVAAKNISETARNEAKASQTAAKTSETNSKTSENAAKSAQTAAELAKTQAEALRAGITQDKADSAASAAAALASQNAAKTSETNAKASENAAKASQTAAKTSETNAKASETAANTSKNSAASSASTATTKASEASTSAAAALASQNAAKTSETNSKTSETNAAASAAAALASKNAAKTSETNAKASELAAELAVEKGLSQVYGGKNLAVLDLSDKRYLGNGVYRLYDLNGITIDYNIFSGNFVMNGLTTSSGYMRLALQEEIYFDYLTFSTYYESGHVDSSSVQWVVYGSSAITSFQTLETLNESKTILINDNVGEFGFYFNNGKLFENYTVKVQIEKGSVSTPYTLPMMVTPETERKMISDNSLYGGKNLAMPDLRGKTIKANGDVELFEVRGLKLTYNIFSGIYTRSGTLTGGSHEYPIAFNLLPKEVITISTQMIKQDGNITTIWEKPNKTLTDVNNKVFTFTTSNEFQHIFLNFIGSTGTEKFKIQLEKGSVATPYTLPLWVTPELLNTKIGQGLYYAVKNGFYDFFVQRYLQIGGDFYDGNNPTISINDNKFRLDNADNSGVIAVRTDIPTTAAQVGARPAGDVPWGEVSGKPAVATEEYVDSKLSGSSNNPLGSHITRISGNVGSAYTLNWERMNSYSQWTIIVARQRANTSYGIMTSCVISNTFDYDSTWFFGLLASDSTGKVGKVDLKLSEYGSLGTEYASISVTFEAGSDFTGGVTIDIYGK